MEREVGEREREKLIFTCVNFWIAQTDMKIPMNSRDCLVLAHSETISNEFGILIENVKIF